MTVPAKGSKPWRCVIAPSRLSCGRRKFSLQDFIKCGKEGNRRLDFLYLALSFMQALSLHRHTILGSSTTHWEYTPSECKRLLSKFLSHQNPASTYLPCFSSCLEEQDGREELNTNKAGSIWTTAECIQIWNQSVLIKPGLSNVTGMNGEQITKTNVKNRNCKVNESH